MSTEDLVGKWSSGTQVWQQTNRVFKIYRPTGFSALRRYPVLMALHGGGTDADLLISQMRMEAYANRHGFLICCPNGTAPAGYPTVRTWNAGSCCGEAVRQGVDDVGYLTRLTDRLIQDFSADRRRVYVTGFSNGSLMAYRFTAARPTVVAACAGVAATIDTSLPVPASPRPILHVHGTADPWAQYNGGPNGQGVMMASVAAHIEWWRAAHSQAGGAATSDTPTITNLTGGTHSKWADANFSVPPIQLITVTGGGHTWPGGYDPYGGRDGILVSTIPASQLIWDFCQQFRL